MRLGRKKDGMDAMRQQVQSSAVARRILQQLDNIRPNPDQKTSVLEMDRLWLSATLRMTDALRC